MNFLPLARPDITEEDIAAVTEVLHSGMLVQGANVMALEQAFCEMNGVKHAIALSNGTATLHLALKVLGIRPGDEVIVPALSYVATANVVELVGAKPVFVDVEERTFNIDVSNIEAAITPQTKAIIPVHEFGLCCDMEAVMEIADRRGIPVIEDAACALGATQNGRFAGTSGLMGSFSLHPRKSITSGEGGVLITNDDALALRLRQWRNHGIEMVEGKMEFVEAGFNYRMTDFQAALAGSQLKRLPGILQKKQALADIYFATIGNEKVALPLVPEGMAHSWQTFHLLLDESMDQYGTMAALKERGIGSNYGAQCIPAVTYYQRKYGLDSAVLFPNALRAYRQGLAIPLYERLTAEDVKAVADAVSAL